MQGLKWKIFCFILVPLYTAKGTAQLLPSCCQEGAQTKGLLPVTQQTDCKAVFFHIGFPAVTAEQHCSSAGFSEHCQVYFCCSSPSRSSHSHSPSTATPALLHCSLLPLSCTAYNRDCHLPSHSAQQHRWCSWETSQSRVHYSPPTG